MKMRYILLVIVAMFAFHDSCIAEGNTSAKKSEVVREARNNKLVGSDTDSLLQFANELRKIRNEEELRADKRLNDAVGKVEDNASFKMCFAGSVFAILLTIFGIGGKSFIRNVVHDKIRAEFEAYTSKKIDEEIVNLSEKLKNRIEKVDKQLDSIRLYSEALSGASSSYDKLKSIAEGDSTAQALLDAVNTYYRAKLFRRVGDYTMEELFWRYKKEDKSVSEIVEQISSARRVTDDVVNLLLNIAVWDDGKEYAALLVEKVMQCDELNRRIAIVDCLHALYEDCPQTPDGHEISSWWQKRNRAQ